MMVTEQLVPVMIKIRKGQRQPAMLDSHSVTATWLVVEGGYPLAKIGSAENSQEVDGDEIPSIHQAAGGLSTATWSVTATRSVSKSLVFISLPLR